MAKLKKPIRVRMIITDSDGKKKPVEPFNRDSQKLREGEAKQFRFLSSFNRALG